MVMSLAFICAIAPFFYLILALQVSSGFPPLYKKPLDGMEAVYVIQPFGFAMMATLPFSIAYPYSIALFGILSAWGGLRIRRLIRDRATGPLPWLVTRRTASAFVRWPMLPFDLWTLGGLIVMALALSYLG
jgi:hypothetical protein